MLAVIFFIQLNFGWFSGNWKRCLQMKNFAVKETTFEHKMLVYINKYKMITS